MQIKKFIAPTLKEASEKMKIELGDDAIVLSTRIVEGNDPFGAQKMFELTAAIELDPAPESEVKNVQPFPKILGKTKNYNSEFVKISNKVYQPITPEKTQETSKFEAELKKLRDMAVQTEKATVIPQPTAPQLVDRVIDDSDSEEYRPFSKPKPKPQPVRHNAHEHHKKQNVQKGLTEEVIFELKEIKDTLLMRDISERTVETILDLLGKYTSLITSKNIDNYVVSTIASMINTSPFEYVKTGRPKIVGLVGPTGVGKTTCIAKLAVISKLIHDLDVGLISLDTYRLGAIDQLRIFSQISNIDMHVAYDSTDLPKYIEKFKNKDIIFIDTAGRAQNNTNSLREIKTFFAKINVDEVYLALSATSSSKYIFDVAEKFKILDYKAFIFTKLDEAVSFGNILNLTVNFDTPLKYITNGQVIPDDIISADPEFIANLIYTNKLTKV